MYFELALAAYAAAAGFVASGFIGSLYQLLTDQPPKVFCRGRHRVLRASVRRWSVFFAGPFIIMRQAIRGRMLEEASAWLARSQCLDCGRLEPVLRESS